MDASTTRAHGAFPLPATRNSAFPLRGLRRLWLLGALALAAGCGDGHRVITPDFIQDHISWSDQELADPQARRLIHSEAGSSTHVLRLAKEEGSHVHDTHDRTLIVVSGSGWVRLGARNYRYGPGDIIEIPRGATHGLENNASDGSEFYEIFAPAYDGRDWRAVKEGAH